MFIFLVVILLVFLVWVGFPVQTALAHDGGPVAPNELWSAWNWDPLILLSILVPAWLYLHGVRSLWEKAGIGRGVSVRHLVAFFAGLLALFAALISPLDALAVTLFSAHMVQHLLLIMVAAPLLVLGAPPAAQAWAIPSPWRVRLGRWWHQQKRLRFAWRGITKPGFVWFVHALAVTIWHIPLFYQAALESEFVHFLEHASFFFTALLFWLVVFRNGSRGQLNYGLSLLFVFTMMMYQGVLGALITFSRSAWYPLYEESTAAWGLTLLEDQQLAGAIMWVPGNFVYLAAFIWLLWEWFHSMERKQSGGSRTSTHRAAASEKPSSTS
jgi:putative membrane protein